MLFRSARSNVLLLQKLKAKVILVAPPTLLPIGIESWGCEISYDLDAILGNIDALLMLRVQRERMQELFFPSEREYSRQFGLTGERLQKLNSRAIVMHPGPMNRGLEISAESADSSQSVIVEQVSNGVYIRMAVLYLLLGGATEMGEQL